MMFDMTGVTREYVDMERDELGVEYTGQEVGIPHHTTTVLRLWRKGLSYGWLETKIIFSGAPGVHRGQYDAEENGK